jgi:hypothetical protein
VTGRESLLAVLMKKIYNSAKDVPHFCPKGLAARRKWGLGQITGGEHISRLVEMPQRKVCLWQTLIEGIIISKQNHDNRILKSV